MPITHHTCILDIFYVTAFHIHIKTIYIYIYILESSGRASRSLDSFWFPESWIKVLGPDPVSGPGSRPASGSRACVLAWVAANPWFRVQGHVVKEWNVRDSHSFFVHDCHRISLGSQYSGNRIASGDRRHGQSPLNLPTCWCQQAWEMCSSLSAPFQFFLKHNNHTQIKVTMEA